MAYARVTLTCSCCGKSFEQSKNCFNSKDAESYKDFARGFYTLCPDCYRDQQIALWASHLPEGLHLPELTGVSDRQVSYASILRKSFIYRVLIKHSVDLSLYFSVRDTLKLRPLAPDLCERLAAEDDLPVDDWLAKRRAIAICCEAHLPHVPDSSSRSLPGKIDAIFSIGDAGRLIDILNTY